MKRLPSAAAALLCAVCSALPALAQYTPVTATQLKTGGVLIPSGTVTFTPVNNISQPIAVVTSDGSLNAPQGFTGNVTAGAIASGFTVPDQVSSVATTASTPISYQVTVYNSASKTGYSFVIPASAPVVTGTSPFLLDHYTPSQAVTVAAAGLMMAGTIPTHCAAPLKLYTPTNPVVNYDCVGGVMVQETSSGGSSNVGTPTAAAQIPVSTGAGSPYTPQALGPVALLPTVAAVNCALNGQNGIYYAACYTGADAGAQIKNADIAALANSVIVASGVLATSTVTTAPSVSANHMLDLQVPLSWSVSPTMASHSRITSTTGAAQTISSTGNWVTATSLNTLEIDHLNVTWSTLVGADDGNKLLKGLGVNHVKVHDNVTTNGGWIETTSTSDTLGANQRTVYTSTTVGTNTSNDVQFWNNTANGGGPCSNPADFSANCASSSYNAYAAFLKFSTNVSYSNNHCVGINTCIFGWGGNNNETTDPQPGDWTSMAEATLKASDFQGSVTNCTNVQACEVYSMVDRVLSVGMIAHGCNDVCGDPEGGQNIQLINFDLSGAKNGELSSFAHGANITFGPGKVNHTSEISWFSDTPSIPKSYSLYLRNGYNDPTTMNNVLVTGVNFQCHRADGLACYGITWDTAYQVRFVSNTFVDTPVFSGYTTSGELPGAEFTSNTFALDITSAASQQSTSGNPFYYELDLSTHLLDRMKLRNNTFQNTAGQYGGSAAIFKGDQFNNTLNGATMALDMQGNTFDNWTGIPMILTQTGASTGPAASVTPRLHTALNDFGTGTMQIAANGVTIDYWIEEKEAKDRGPVALSSGGTQTLTLAGYYLTKPDCTASGTSATVPLRASVTVSGGVATLVLSGAASDTGTYACNRHNT